MAGPPLGTLIKEHLEACPHSKLTSRVSAFKAFWDDFHLREPATIKGDEMSLWFHKFQLQRDLSQRTMNRIKSCFNHLFLWLEDNGHISVNPLTKVKYRENQKPRRQRVVLSVDEIHHPTL